MRASQDQCIHAFIGQRGQIPPGGRKRSLIVRLDPSVFHKGDKQGAGDGITTASGRISKIRLSKEADRMVAAVPRIPDAPCFRRGYGGVGGGFHHPPWRGRAIPGGYGTRPS